MEQDYWNQWTDNRHFSRQRLSSNPLAAKQRNVAQQRRRLEAEEFQKLSAVLPISRAISEQHIDKTTIVRLASSYIKLHHLLGSNYSNFGSYDPWNGSLIDIIDGFLLVLNESGDILYVSETISLHLGLSQVEMIGNIFSNYLHSADVFDLQRLLKTVTYNYSTISSTFRIKSTLTKRSTKDMSNPNAGYKPITITINCYYQNMVNNKYIVGYCQPHQTVIGNNIKLNNDTFILTTDYSFNLLYVDPHVLSLIHPRYSSLNHLNPSSSTHHTDTINWTKGSNLYSLVSPDDAYLLQDLHLKLFKYPSTQSSLIKLISDDQISTFTVEIFGISYYNNLPPANYKNNLQQEHFILICTYIG